MPVQFAEITAEQLEERGLYQILRAKSVTIRVAKQKIGARRARKKESELLNLDKGGPVLTMERVAYDQAGQAIEFGHHCYRPDITASRQRSSPNDLRAPWAGLRIDAHVAVETQRRDDQYLRSRRGP